MLNTQNLNSYENTGKTINDIYLNQLCTFQIKGMIIFNFKQKNAPSNTTFGAFSLLGGFFIDHILVMGIIVNHTINFYIIF